jgi:hypothetical protein
MARTPRQFEDERLALRCRLGEPAAFAELVATMERPLMYFVRSTVLLTGSGLLIIHKIEGTWIAVNGVFWFLFGAVFFFVNQINQRSREVIKEIRGVELRLAALEERLAGQGDVAGTPD